MGKKSSDSKAANKLAKKEKQATKSAKAERKLAGKGKGKEENLEEILAQFQEDWQKAHAVKDEVQAGAPSRRASATLTAYGDHLWLIGGEYFDGQKAHFYNDTFRYSPDKNEWRLYTCPTAPPPRSAHAVVPLAKEGGQLWLFGGEYSSSNQSNFLHYRDLWCFSVKDHSWAKVEVSKGPSARSGHRMAVWKQYIVLFGGFQDTGIKTTYLSDLWLFDTELYKWKQVETKDAKRAPGPRSGFSMIPCPEGVIVYGGYKKEYTGGKNFVGLALDDMWTLKMDADLTKLVWEKRKKGGLAPSSRSGCSMTHWATKGMGVLFGGVHDEEEKEDMKSVFYNDLFSYNPANNKWSMVTLQAKKKKMGGGGAKAKRLAREAKALAAAQSGGDGQDVDMDAPTATPAAGDEEDDSDEDSDAEEKPAGENGMDVESQNQSGQSNALVPPLVRYNAMIAVLKNTFYLYGGSWESSRREYTLDDFYSLNLDKRDGYVTLRATNIEGEDWQGSDDEDEMDVEGEEEDDEEDGDDSEDSDEDDEE